ncbi:kinase-interacting protein 1 [Artemisia annua]|uniref:Kinase-interacting protein 1 n=1 Tax=Artemisia annua TaxID=35608 RepID=A0A2U1N7J8_ARTAN|nr:kinase-interacting protein 1 [Artemisia annua]
MLQRAASNAFSWWWASHIRTKQSKWLEQSLLDMEEKVHNALNIIQKDGDSFARRAEMYYRHRPDLICFVEETFRAYRSLAERYDKLSRDLQKANTTIASIFPDQVSYDDFDEFDGPPKMPKNMPPQNKGPNAANIPKVPQLPRKNLKGLISNASKKMEISKAFKEDNPNRIVPKSGLTEEEAIEEIDKIQKEILAMQTMKEFTKSAYENGLSKYWEIENKINTMQQKVCRLQDEFKVGRVIEDGDARTVMAQAALKSCKETLEMLEEKRENSSQAARLEHQKITDVKEKFTALKRKFLPHKVKAEKNVGSESQISNQTDEEKTIAKVKESLEELSRKPLTVSELADTIDKLANKVISLESTVSSQTAHIDTLRNQTSDLQTQIQNLESDKDCLADVAYMRRKLKTLDTKMNGLADLEKDVEKQDNTLKVHFTEARCGIDHLSEKIHDVQPDDEEIYSPASEGESFKSEEGDVDVWCVTSEEQKLNLEESVVEEREVPCMDDDEHIHKKTDDRNNDYDNKNHDNDEDSDSVKNDITTIKEREMNDDEGVKYMNTTWEKGEKNDDGVMNADTKKGEAKLEERHTRTNDDLVKNSDYRTDTRYNERGNLDDDECKRNPLKQYTTTLKNYKETKKKLSEEEKKKLGTLFELIVQVKELKTGIVKRDSEIQLLKQKLNQLQNEENWQEERQDDISLEEKEDEDINISIDDPETVSEIEEKFRTDIDAILDENLDFWLRFSTQFHQVQKFKTEVADLKGEIGKVKTKGAEAKTNEEKTNQSIFTTDFRSDIRPIYKHLKEIQSELILWLEQAADLKEELQSRRSSLSNIQEEITMALKEGMLEDEIKFSTHHAAKFQGELLNMEQENNRVNEELEAGLDHVKALHHEIRRILRKLKDEFGLSENQNPYQQTNSVRSPTNNRPGIPLRSFIFGVKAKKQKPSIFNYVNTHKKTKGGRT